MVTITHTNTATANNGGFTIKKLEERIKDIYLSLLKQGYKLNEIDGMDIHFYFELLDKNKPKQVYIDQIL